jgi:hypothetical protein
MNFTYTLTEQLGQLRLRVGDTVKGSGPRPYSDRTNFGDAELQHLIDTQPSLGAAAATAFEILASEWSSYTNITLGPRKEEFAKISDSYRKQAAQLRKIFGGATTFSVGFDRVDGYSVAADLETEHGGELS